MSQLSSTNDNPPVSTIEDPNSKSMQQKAAYLNNKDLLAEVVKCKKTGRMSNKLAEMLQLLCFRYSRKGNFVGYSFNEDMQAYAMLMLVRTWESFDPERGSNAFAFFTQCIMHSFVQYLNKEKVQRTIRDKMLVDQGLNPSYSFHDDGDSGKIEDEQDFDSMQATLRRQEMSFTDQPIERDDRGREVESNIVEVDQDHGDVNELSTEDDSNVQ